MKENYWTIELEHINPKSRDIANEFLYYLIKHKKSKNTVDKYRRVLGKFLTEYSIPLNLLTSNDVGNWFDCNYGNKKDNTKIFILSTLASFFKYCQGEEYIIVPLIKKRWRPRKPKLLPKYLDEHEVARVKIHAESMSLRDRALEYFLLSSGCRRSEASGLNIDSVDLKNRTAVVKGKGGKLRDVHFS